MPSNNTAQQTEEYLIASGHGKWSSAGVPHKGWVCIDIADSGEPLTRCEMCETRMIRYIHYMQHPRYSGILEAGCVCAGHMEDNLVASRARDESMKSRGSKRTRWLSRVWKTSAKGNPWIKTNDGFIVTVFPRDGGWAASIATGGNSKPAFSRCSHKCQDDAKLAAFDCITRILIDRTR